MTKIISDLMTRVNDDLIAMGWYKEVEYHTVMCADCCSGYWALSACVVVTFRLSAFPRRVQHAILHNSLASLFNSVR